MHRWIWDVRYAPVAGGGGRGGGGGFGGGGGGLWALPGAYTVKLTVNGQTYTQPLEVKLDPHVKTPLPALQRQFSLAQEVQQKQMAVNRARQEATHVLEQIANLKKQAGGNAPLAASLDALDTKAGQIGGVVAVSSPDSSGVGEPSSDFSSLLFFNGELGQVFGAMEGTDAAPANRCCTPGRRRRKRRTRRSPNGMRSRPAKSPTSMRNSSRRTCRRFPPKRRPEDAAGVEAEAGSSSRHRQV